MEDLEIEAFFLSRGKRSTPRRTRRVPPPAQLTTGRGSAWKHTHTGYREDIDLSTRSGWEANVARILHAYGVAYAFEPEVFVFPIKRGTRGYTPDFLLTGAHEWLEVKGYFDGKSHLKLKRFKKYYPEEFARLTLIIGKVRASIAICEELGAPYLFYPEIARVFAPRLKNWE